MAIPDYQALMLPLLALASDGQERRTKEAGDHVAKQLGLTEQELSQLTPSGSDFVFFNRFSWARTYLKKAGLITYPAWGRFQITEAGRALIAEKPVKIDLGVLKRYTAFLSWWSPLRPTAEITTEMTPETNSSKETPEELAVSIHASLRVQLQNDLLARVISGSPQYFERLVVKLLTAMGYGGSLVDAGQALGGSGDGGIDGVIKEDKLGLDLIYIQAKRWGSNSVGAPDIQGFVGALAGKKARKGVFITTSKFTKSAISYAAGLENRVILIDGERLTELMFEYGIGVTTISTYEVKRIDQDFFDEDE